MRHRLVIGLLCGVVSVCGTAATSALEFSDFFTGATMRVDLYHTGDATMEYVAIDQVRIEGPWPGSRTQLVDHTNMGIRRSAAHSECHFISIFGSRWTPTNSAG